MGKLDKALVDVERVGEIIDGEQMPEAQRKRLKDKIGDLFAKEGEVPIEALRDELLKIVADAFVKQPLIRASVQTTINEAFSNQEAVEAVQQAFRVALGEQADWLKRQAEDEVKVRAAEAIEEIRERVETALEDLSLQTLLDFTGVMEADLTPAERSLIEGNVRQFLDQALAQTS